MGNLAFAAVGPRPSAGENVLSGTHGVGREWGLVLWHRHFRRRFGRSCADFLPFLLLRCLCGHCCHSPAVLAVGSFEGFPRQGLGKVSDGGLPLAMDQSSGQWGSPSIPMSVGLQLTPHCWEAS